MDEINTEDITQPSLAENDILTAPFIEKEVWVSRGVS